jgi:hypothetical protein
MYVKLSNPEHPEHASVARFLNSGVVSHDPDGHVLKDVFYVRYQQWATGRPGIHAGNRHAVTQIMHHLGYREVRAGQVQFWPRLTFPAS